MLHNTHDKGSGLDLGIGTVKDLVLSPQPNGFFAIVIHVMFKLQHGARLEARGCPVSPRSLWRHLLCVKLLSVGGLFDMQCQHHVC